MDTTRTSAREATAVDDRLHGGATVPGETLMTLTNTESATITKVTTTSDGGCKGEATATLRGPLTRAAKRCQQAAAKTRQAVRESDVGNSSEKPATANLDMNACCRRRLRHRLHDADVEWARRESWSAKGHISVAHG
ncbi:hypothetical protein PR002_g31067 [Phytophthora rubi]|uniref:Uncharacterized protein n=1 Tax=Phytophthora rubi TaxID=129364 RepID=A0A6A3GJZ6_9STRA|nr:hypothetical protein PR002_g31067 [Phytophthora rubi]